MEDLNETKIQEELNQPSKEGWAAITIRLLGDYINFLSLVTKANAEGRRLYLEPRRGTSLPNIRVGARTESSGEANGGGEV